MAGRRSVDLQTVDIRITIPTRYKETLLLPGAPLDEFRAMEGVLLGLSEVMKVTVTDHHEEVTGLAAEMCAFCEETMFPTLHRRGRLVMQRKLTS